MNRLTKKDIKTALLVGIPLAFVAALIFHFGVTYSDELLIPNMPLDNFQTLPYQEQMKIIDSQQALRVVTGYEKVIYILKASPITFLYYWLAWALPLCFAIIFGSWSVRRSINLTHHSSGTP
ncbi:MAG: hypothetical protein U1C59_09680, partial [Methylotenera sp.]|nr:hypothetical protein [Methylotenera sp.]